MKDGLRFVDCDMHIMEPPDLFERYLDPAFKHRVSTPVGADGRPARGVSGTIYIDGLPTSDSDVQQYRKRRRPGPTHSTQPLSSASTTAKPRSWGWSWKGWTSPSSTRRRA